MRCLKHLPWPLQLYYLEPKRAALAQTTATSMENAWTACVVASLAGEGSVAMRWLVPMTVVGVVYA